MPALPNVPNVVRLEHLFHLDEDTRAKVRSFWRYVTGPPTQAELDTAVIAVKLAFSTNMPSVLHNAWSMAETILTDLSSPSAPVSSLGGSVAGALAGERLTAAACLLQSNEIARRFRGGHPREYWPLGNADHTADSQTWTDAFVTSCTTDLGLYETAVKAALAVFGGTVGKVAVSYHQGNTVFIGPTGRARNISNVRATPIVDTILSTKVQKGIASQRRRLLHLA